MSYTSGDWTARTKYLLGSKLCFPTSDEDALEQFLAGNPVRIIGPSCPPCGCTEPDLVPYFPVYNGPPASMEFDAGVSMTLTDTSATLCEATLVTNTSGKIGIWANVDASGDPITLTISINGSVVESSVSSYYMFHGTQTAVSAGTYIIHFRVSTTGTTNIVSSRLMAVGLLT